MDASKDQLVRRAQQGDLAALDQLCHREWRAVYMLIFNAVPHRPEAEDLTQEVFYRALTALNRYQDTGRPFRAYLATIARNLIRDRWRRSLPRTAPLDALPEFEGPGPSPEELVIADAQLTVFRQALEALPPDYQSVIRLRVVDGRSTAEVAALMDRSTGAIRVLQHRALVLLRDQLQKGSFR